MTINERLATYLNDHLGGANAGVELARRLQNEVQGGPDAAILGRMAEEIEEDLETLRSITDMIGGTSSLMKQAAGWVAEKAHRMGLAADTAVVGSPDLTRLLEAESLSLGVEGKRCLWSALIEVVPDYPQLAGMNFPELVARAEDQRRRIETVRISAARRAFARAEGDESS
jgi:hypothetical protein